MAFTKEQYVNAIGFLKVFTSRIENSSKIIFDTNSTEEEKDIAKQDSEDAVQKIYKLLNTVSEKQAYAAPQTTYSDVELVLMRIYSEQDAEVMGIQIKPVSEEII